MTCITKKRHNTPKMGGRTYLLYLFIFVVCSCSFNTVLINNRAPASDQSCSTLIKTILKSELSPVEVDFKNLDLANILDNPKFFTLRGTGESTVPQRFMTLNKSSLPDDVKNYIKTLLHFSWQSKRYLTVINATDQSQAKGLKNLGEDYIADPYIFSEVQLFVAVTKGKDGKRTSHISFGTDFSQDSISGVTIFNVLENAIYDLLDDNGRISEELIEIYDFHTHPSTPEIGDGSILPARASSLDIVSLKEKTKTLSRQYGVDLDRVKYHSGVVTFHPSGKNEGWNDEIVISEIRLQPE